MSKQVEDDSKFFVTFSEKLNFTYLWKYSGKDSVDACLDCAGDGTERCRVDAKDDDEINVFRGPPPWDSVNFSARPLIWRVSAV